MTPLGEKFGITAALYMIVDAIVDLGLLKLPHPIGDAVYIVRWVVVSTIIITRVMIPRLRLQLPKPRRKSRSMTAGSLIKLQEERCALSIGSGIAQPHFRGSARDFTRVCISVHDNPVII